MKGAQRRFHVRKDVLNWLYESNSCANIGKMFGFGDETIRKKLIELDVKRRASNAARNKIPSKKALKELYPKKTLEEVGTHFNVSGQVILKWLIHHKIPTSKKYRNPRTEEHSRNASKARKGKIFEHLRTGRNKPCLFCGQLYRNSARQIRKISQTIRT